MAGGSGMSNGVKLGILLALAGAGYLGWRAYSKGLQSKTDSELFEMVAEGGAKGGVAEGELTLRARTDKIAAGTLRSHLHDTSPKARIAAISGISVKKDKDSARDLIGMLNDPKEDVEVKEAACKAFADIRVKEAVGPLVAQLRTSSSAVREAASNSLRSITGQAYSNKEVDKWELWWTENSKTFEVKDK